MAAGYGPSAIRKRIAQDDGYTVPLRTLSAQIAKLRADRGDPETIVEPGSEAEAAENLARTTLALLADQTKRLGQAAKTRPLTGAEVETLRRSATAALDLRRRFGKEQQHNRPKGATNEPGKLLKQLATGPSSPH